MTHTTPSPADKGKVLQTFLLVVALLVALFLRTYRLDEVPEGVDYDEAGNFILAGEIARGESFPIFIRAYAGREALFYWLAGASMRLLGETLFAFRLAAALCGLGTVLLTYVLAREMFHDGPEIERRWVPLLSTVLIAISYWHVHVSRYGFRVNAMPLLVTASMALLWRGLREKRRRWVWLVLGGLLCGLSANTYLAVRAFPLVLLVFALWVILTWPAGTRLLHYGSVARVRHSEGIFRGISVRHRDSSIPEHSAAPPLGMTGSADLAATLPARETTRQSFAARLGQFAVFGLAALIALAPLAIFFVQNPAFFGIRMGQASVFSPEIHGGDLWGTLGQVTIKALGVFTFRGDADPIYNTPGKPIFGPFLGGAFYCGLVACLYRAIRAPTHRQRTPYLLILVWLPVMLVPNILGARGVPHALRSMGIVPVVYYVPALGLVAAVQIGKKIVSRLRQGQRGIEMARYDTTGDPHSPHAPLVGALALVLLLVVGALQTGQAYFTLWANSAGAYYNGSASLRRAGEYLGEQDPNTTDLWVSNSTYRHTSYAATCAHYSRLNWFSGDTLILPRDRERPMLVAFDFTNPLDPVLARYVPPSALVHRDLGPDGKVGFEVYRLLPEQMPQPQPQVEFQSNLGNAIAFLGYDLNAPPVSGETLDVTLYFRALRDGDRDDYAFFCHLVDDLGFRWGGETFFHYPSLQWREGDVMLFRQQIEIAPGAPPGTYAFDLGIHSSSLDARLPVLNDAGQMAGTAVHVEPVEIAQATGMPETLPAIQQPLENQLAGGALTLVGADRDRGDLRPGETLALSLYWQAKQAVAEDFQVAIWLARKDAVVPLWQGDPAHGTYPFARWQPPEFVRDRYALRLPTDTPAGDYALRVALVIPGKSAFPPAAGDEAVTLSTIHVQATDRLWEPPSYAHPVNARLGEVVELLGYDLSPTEANPGEPVQLTLIWRCLAEMDTAYTVFTHLLDGGEQVRGQKDNPPVQGHYPTTLWVEGEVVVDSYEIEVQADAPPGMHVIEVGMYDPATVQRLPVLDPSGTVGDRVLLGQVTVK